MNTKKHVIEELLISLVTLHQHLLTETCKFRKE